MVVTLGCTLLAACQPPDSQPARQDAAGAAGEPAATSTTAGERGPESSSKWEFHEATDAISRESTSSAKVRITDPAASGLLVDLEFSCGPDQRIYGRPPYVSVTSWESSGATQDPQPFIDFNSAAPLEFRFNGRPVNVSVDLLEQFSAQTGRLTPQAVQNQVRVSVALLNAGGMDDGIKANPFAIAGAVAFLSNQPKIFISDTDFALRMTTSAGTLTYVTTLDTPEIRRVLEACGVAYGPDTSIDARNVPRQFAGDYQFKDEKGENPVVPVVLKFDSVERQNDIIEFSGTQRIDSAGALLNVKGTIDALTRKFAMTENDPRNTEEQRIENAGSYEGMLSEDLHAIDALWTTKKSGEQAVYKVRAETSPQ